MATDRSDIELLTEHFGYPPVSLLDDIINSINILAERALNSVEQGLLNAPPASLGFRPPTHSSNPDDGLPDAKEAQRHEIETGTHQLETLLCATIDKNFDKFELYVMRYLLCVQPEDRDWIRLSHYEGLDFLSSSSSPTKGGGDAPTVESVHHLRRRLQASQKLNCMLSAEKARNAALLGAMRRLVVSPSSASKITVKEEEQDQDQQPEEEATAAAAPFRFLQNQGTLASGGADTPLTTTTAFTLSQLQALRSLSSSLRNIMPDLNDENNNSLSDDDNSSSSNSRKKTWRRERLEYVEAATRKHLENVRGLELGKNGEVRDGEWHGEGRSLGTGEVEGLENVVAILGGGGGPSGGNNNNNEGKRGLPADDDDDDDDAMDES
ncbi:Mis12 protein-domain-containing protein [Podospora didyma]|uniref:Mis12 protein-domain-containing protein n=1 Tax=Podospora didyma TaxID=330526 RepID=A0AAE0KFX9_9PEZI|nr:Mis12 protein-domain-containing protein [Podospora didyma]